MSNSLTIVEEVEGRINELETNSKIDLPFNYSVNNALKSAWLILQNTQDRNKKQALEVCTKSSIANALLSMIIQGLNPDKEQCYFIVYGKDLVLMRSYFGSMAVAKRLDDNVDDIFSDVVYKNDIFEYKKERGVTKIIKHEQKLENIDNKNIVAAYCTVVSKDGKENTEIMTMEQIKQAWKQSALSPVDDKGNIREKSTHDKFTEEMCKRTVTNRACKSIINTSDDRNIVVNCIKENEAHKVKVELDEKKEIYANKEVINMNDDEFMEIDSTEIREESLDIEKEQTVLEEAPY